MILYIDFVQGGQKVMPEMGHSVFLYYCIILCESYFWGWYIWTIWGYVLQKALTDPLLVEGMLVLKDWSLIWYKSKISENLTSLPFTKCNLFDNWFV